MLFVNDFKIFIKYISIINKINTIQKNQLLINISDEHGLKFENYSFAE